MTTKREILVRDLRLGHLSEQLPDNVFPIQVTVALARAEYKDETVMGPPEYPVPVKRSAEVDYIPTHTVYFGNPVEYPDSGQVFWRFEDFAEKIAEQGREVKNTDPKADERLYLSKIRLTEIPERYLVYKRGRVERIDKRAYEDHERVAIATFDKRPKIEDESVREDLGTSLPGKVMKPLRLTKLKEVTLKPHLGTSQTTTGTCRRKYYTDGQAESDPGAQLGWSPTEWDSVIWKQVEQWFPNLAASEFVHEVEFVGEHELSKKFVEKEARVVNRAGAKVSDGGTFSPRLSVHTGYELLPAEPSDLPDDVREHVDAVVAASGADEVEVRHYGDDVFTVIQRFGGEGGD